MRHRNMKVVILADGGRLVLQKLTEGELHERR